MTAQNYKEDLSYVKHEAIKLQKEILDLKHNNHDLSLVISDLKKNKILNIIEIIDTFDSAERRVINSFDSLTQEQLKIIKSYNIVKSKCLKILDEENVQIINLENNLYIEHYCKVIDVEPSSTHPNGYVLSIIKEGYVQGITIIRKKEVVIVKN